MNPISQRSDEGHLWRPLMNQISSGRYFLRSPEWCRLVLMSEVSQPSVPNTLVGRSNENLLDMLLALRGSSPLFDVALERTTVDLFYTLPPRGL